VTTLQHVHAALRALAPVGWTIYDDEAPGSAVAPWVVVGLQVPESILAETGSHGGTARWWVTVSAETAGQARVIADACDKAWSGAGVRVPGFTLGALRPGPPSGPYPAGLTALDTNLRFQVVRMPFDLTLSRTE